jgi:hypothetical protein
VALVPPEEVGVQRRAPAGFLSLVGALADWDEIDVATADVYAARRRAKDRPTPELR